MNLQIKLILKEDWYKTATPEEMRIALFHLQCETANVLMGELNEQSKKFINKCFEECSDDNGWNS